MYTPYNSRGFSLVEMAVVLVIFGLLLGSLLLPLSAQIDQRNYVETENELDSYQESLLGYAASHSATDGHPYLPCPDTDNDGFENRTGSACTSISGNVPWATLGLKQQDSWNNTYQYRVAAAFSDNGTGFSLSSTGNINVLDASAGATVASGVPAIVLSKGKSGAGTGADELENSDNDNTFVSHTPTSTPGNEFDDLSVWIPTTILFNRMITAGKLP